MSNQSSSTGGIGIGGLLLVLFVALKLTHQIEWTWFWVLSPVWIPLAVVAFFFVLFVLLHIMAHWSDQ